MLAWLPILPIYIAARVAHEIAEIRRRGRTARRAAADAWDAEWAHA